MTATTFYEIEYKALEDRLTFLRQDLVKTETIVPLAVAAIYSWAFTATGLSRIGQITLFWLPAIIAVAAFLRHWSRYNAIERIEAYLTTLEAACVPMPGDGAAAVPPGYHRWLLERKDHLRARRWAPPLKWSRRILWSTILIGTLAVGLVATVAPAMIGHQACR